MGSGTAKTVRLDLGIDLRDRIHTQKGTDEDIRLVLNEAPSFMDNIAQQFVQRATIIRSDRDCFRLLHDDVVIEIPARKRPTLADVQASWGYIEKIERDDSTEEPVTLRLSTVLKSTEGSIDGPTYERRLTVLRGNGRLLGFQHRKFMFEVQKQYPALMALLGEVYIDFSGIIVVNQDGRRYVPYARSGGGRFADYWDGLGDDFSGLGRVAVSAK